jgi:putative acetyltransferase
MHAIRAERPEDIGGIRQVNLSAFETSAEADLVDALRRQARPFVSLVAVEGEEVVGHILFSPVTLSSDPAAPIMGLAPMAVRPDRQRQGVGSALVRAGLEECRLLDAIAVVVLGHAHYYPRFGFTRASAFGLASEYDVPDDVFMVLELRAGLLREKRGTISYHPAFANV